MKKLTLDYSVTRTVQDLESWFVEQMSFTQEELELDNRFIVAIFKALANRGNETGDYDIEQIKANSISKEISEVLDGQDGWKQALGFHLSREGSGAGVRFLEKTNWWKNDCFNK